MWMIPLDYVSHRDVIHSYQSALNWMILVSTYVLQPFPLSDDCGESSLIVCRVFTIHLDRSAQAIVRIGLSPVYARLHSKPPDASGNQPRKAT